MLSRKNRVNKGFFEKNRSGGVSFSGETSTLKVFPGEVKNQPIFGFIVSKKVSPKATTRNKIKRRFSGIVEKNLDKFKIGSIFIFYIKKEALPIPFLDLEKDILELNNKIK